MGIPMEDYRDHHEVPGSVHSPKSSLEPDFYDLFSHKAFLRLPSYIQFWIIMSFSGWVKQRSFLEFCAKEMKTIPRKSFPSGKLVWE